MATRVFFYTLRPYDELGIAQRLAPQLDVEFGSTQEYPTLKNAELAKGYDAVSVTPCDMSAPMVKRFHELGVKSICCRSIGYDHVDRETARELGMKVANVDYPPNGVANFAIMLMLMSLRKAGHILKRGEAQDYSLQGKIGRDISTCTVGVIGTGRIGRTVLQHLSGFGCRLLAYDLYPNDEVKKIAEYVPLETLLAESDVITLHTNATEENHHLIDTKAIESMKPGVTIINTARGKLIDSDALIAGLESGKIGAAGLDVLENENGLYYYNRMGDVIPNPELAALRAERAKAEEAAANAVSASVPAPAPKPAAAKPAPAAPKPQPKKAARPKSVEPKPSRDEMTFAQRMVTSKEPTGENEIPGMAPAQKIIIVLALIAFVIFMGYTILTSMGLL